MYSLVAIGFVLIYKASGVFNFAQGAMVFFAALTFVSITERGVNLYLALAMTLAVMIAMGLAIERFVLRYLVNQSPMALFMATIGLSFCIEGLAETLWGGQVHGLELGIDDRPLEIDGVLVSTFDLFAAGTAGLMVLALALFFNKTRTGLSLRAVADDHLAALAIGVPLQRIWGLAWPWPEWSASSPDFFGAHA